MKNADERIFEEMTKKTTVMLRNGEVYLTCEDHSVKPLREHFDEGYLECAVCGWRITLEQARTLVNDVLVNVSALFDLLDDEIKQRGSALEMAA